MMKMCKNLTAIAALTLCGIASAGTSTLQVIVRSGVATDDQIQDKVNLHMPQRIRDRALEKGLAFQVQAMSFQIDAGTVCIARGGFTEPATSKATARNPVRSAYGVQAYPPGYQDIQGCEFEAIKWMIERLTDYADSHLAVDDSVRYEASSHKHRDPQWKPAEVHYFTSMPQDQASAVIQPLLKAGFSKVVDSRDVSVLFFAESFLIGKRSFCLGNFSLQPTPALERSARYNPAESWYLYAAPLGEVCRPENAVYGAMRSYLTYKRPAEKLRANFELTDDGRVPSNVAAIAAALPAVAKKLPY